MSEKSLKVETIGMTFNLRKKGVEGDDYEEYDEIETIDSLKKEFEKYGFRVALYEQDQYLFERLSRERPDFVFNIAEGIGSTRSRESQVPCMLEALKIPHSGSDPLSLGITLDKYFTNVILASAGVPVPRMRVVRSEKDMPALKKFIKGKKLYVVKPRWEGSSKGIYLKSLVSNYALARERSKEIIKKYKQPAVVEEFLERDEITVGVAGNGDKIEILGMMRISPTDEKNKKFLYSIEVKREWEKMVRYEAEKDIPKKIRAAVAKSAMEAFRVLELRDVSRVDFRLDSANVPKVIDINPLPGLSPFYSDLPILYRLNGKKYSELIKIILKHALARYGLRPE
jgi:D-alanine-D-alanine ligase